MKVVIMGVCIQMACDIFLYSYREKGAELRNLNASTPFCLISDLTGKKSGGKFATRTLHLTNCAFSLPIKDMHIFHIEEQLHVLPDRGARSWIYPGDKLMLTCFQKEENFISH